MRTLIIPEKSIDRLLRFIEFVLDNYKNGQVRFSFMKFGNRGVRFYALKNIIRWLEEIEVWKLKVNITNPKTGNRYLNNPSGLFNIDLEALYEIYSQYTDQTYEGWAKRGFTSFTTPTRIRVLRPTPFNRIREFNRFDDKLT